MLTDSLSCSGGEAGKISAEQRRRINAILDDNQVMTLATNRPDGWPQATPVNYLHNSGLLYFVVARNSQKLANIQQDGRVSITVGGARKSQTSGLSIAAMVTEVTEGDQIAQLNTLLWNTPAGKAYSPHPGANSIAVLKATPRIISLIDYALPPGQAQTILIEEPGPRGAISGW